MGEKTQQGAENRSRPNKRSSSRRALSPRPSIQQTPSNEYIIGMHIGDVEGLEEPEEPDSEDAELEENTNPLIEYYDQHGLPKGSIDSGTTLDHMAGVLKTSSSRPLGVSKRRARGRKSVRFAEDILPDELSATSSWDIDSQIEDREEGSNDASSSPDISSGDEESDSTDGSETTSSGSDSDGSNNESSSDSSSDDGSAPEEESSKIVPDKQKASGEGVSINLTANSRKSVPPGEGRKQTKARNIRRRNAKALQKLQETGVSPADTSAAEFNKLDIDANTTKEDAMGALDVIRSARLPQANDDFAVRRQKLLDSLESGGIEVGHESAEPETFEDSTREVSTQSIPTSPPEPIENATPPRRARLDLGAGRRLLFGALGIKNPKTKHDEDKLRVDLMKGVRPLVAPKPDSSAPAAHDDDLDEDPDAWRQSITYRAVECCHNDVQLSEPPFPFVQRWDPQQQGNRSKHGTQSGKRKKDLRDDPQFYDSNQRPSKKQKLRKAKHGYAEEAEYLDGSYEPSYEEGSTIVDYDDGAHDSELPEENATSGVRSQLLNGLNYGESAGSSQEPADLAPLPEDPSTLPDLMVGQVMTGMTIAFKQLIMSETTKWQPQISAYRTAIIIANPDNGELHLTLALRDRKLPEKYYDEETGNRIYGKFDMPIEEDDEDQDDGMLNLQFSELLEPKIVQNAPDSLIIDSAADAAAPTVPVVNSDHLSPLNNTAFTEEQPSHVTETPLYTDVPESYASAQDIVQEQESIGQRDTTELSGSNGQYSVHKADARVEEWGANSAGRASDAEITEMAVSALGNGVEAISDEARQDISLMMKEAGFRSSVPSSVRKHIRPNGIESPGDTAIFEKLMKDMTEIEGHFPSSPKFNGFGSSSPIRHPGPHASSTTNISEQPLSSPAPPQSSWQTIPLDEPSSPPAETQAEEIGHETPDVPEESWETIHPSVLAANQVKPKPKPKPKRKLHMAQSIQNANQLWEQLSRPTRNKPNAESSVDNTHDTPELSTELGLDAVGGRDSNASILYPKLSIGSSFTSQISDHGRQPDVIFEDSTTLDGDLAKPAAEDSSATRDNDIEQPGDPVSDAEVDLPTHSAEIVQAAKGKGKQILLDLPSSDSLFPPLEVVLSQRDTRRKERTASSNADEDDREHSAMALSGEESLEDSNHSTPKASKSSSRTSRRSASQPNPKTRSSVPRSSQTPVSQSEPEKFVIPEGSQTMDLTLSSDAEVEQDSLDAYMPAFRRYKMADDDDDDYRDGGRGKKGGGWVKKKKASSQTESPRRSGKRLSSSSQTSSNARSSRKKTVAKL